MEVLLENGVGVVRVVGRWAWSVCPVGLQSVRVSRSARSGLICAECEDEAEPMEDEE